MKVVVERREREREKVLLGLRIKGKPNGSHRQNNDATGATDHTFFSLLSIVRGS